MILLQQKAPSVDARISRQVDEDRKNPRECLEVIISSLKFLGRQFIAIRGHLEEDSNFQQLLPLRQSSHPALLNWLKRHNDFTSPQILNEILEIFTKTVLRHISCTLRAQPFLAVMVDGTTDCSGIEQESISIRYVDDNLQPQEVFLSLYDMSHSTSGQSLTDMIKDVMYRFGLPVEKLRAQCYDGAANTSDIYNGAQ